MDAKTKAERNHRERLARMDLDNRVYAAGILINNSRWLAADDAKRAVEDFDCVFGVPVNEAMAKWAVALKVRKSVSIRTDRS